MKIISEYKGTFEVDKAFYDSFNECTSKDECRSSLNNIFWDAIEKAFVSTDGRRLIYHKTKMVPEEIESGFYDLAKIKKTYKLLPVQNQNTFPAWQRVLPDLSRYEKQPSSLSLSGNLNTDNRTICDIILLSKCIININFLLKVLKSSLTFELYLHKEQDLSKPLYFQMDKDTVYILMPMLRSEE